MYTKKSLKQFILPGVLVCSCVMGSSWTFADPAPSDFIVTPVKKTDADNYSSTGDTSSSTGTETYTPPRRSIASDDDDSYSSSTGWSREPASTRPHPIYSRPEAPTPRVGSYDRSGDPQEAAMLVACSLERRPYGSPFVDGRVASNWRWSDVRRDPRREIEFSQKRHGSAPFENAVCELFMLKRMLEQGGNASLTYRCELIRNDLARSYANLQSGGVSSQSAFGLLDSVMGSRSSDNGERICRDPNTEELFACATQDLGSHLGNTSMQRKAAENVMSLCVSRGANMNSSAGYFNAGIIPGGAGFCGPTGGGFVGGGGFGGGVAVIQSHEPWYKTVLSAGLGALKVLGPLKVLDDAHERREKTSQLAVASNANLGFPSVVQGAGMWGGGGAYGYGTGVGMGVGFGMGAGGMCGIPPYTGCGGGGFGIGFGGSFGGGGGGFSGGFGGGVGYPGMGYPGGPGMGYPGIGYPGGPGMGIPGPFGTAGGTNGWTPGFGGGYGYPGAGYGGVGGYPGAGGYPGVGYPGGPGYGPGANNGYFIDSFGAQQSRMQNRNNRYGMLYDNLGTDSRANSGNLRNTFNSYSSGSNGGYNYYPPYSPY